MVTERTQGSSNDDPVSASLSWEHGLHACPQPVRLSGLTLMAPMSGSPLIRDMQVIDAVWGHPRTLRGPAECVQRGRCHAPVDRLCLTYLPRGDSCGSRSQYWSRGEASAGLWREVRPLS